jgi:hypothetical protein
VSQSVYLSASYARKGEIAEIARGFRQLGFRVMSTWHDGPDVCDDVNAEDAGELAETDLSEIDVSEIFVGFTDGFHNRAGHHVELGAALMECDVVVVVGPVENHFHRHRRVTRLDDVDALWRWIGVHLVGGAS